MNWKHLIENKYERLFNEIYSDKVYETLSNIYESILLVNEISMVKKQVEAINIYQRLFLTSNEQNVSE